MLLAFGCLMQRHVAVMNDPLPAVPICPTSDSVVIVAMTVTVLSLGKKCLQVLQVAALFSLICTTYSMLLQGMQTAQRTSHCIEGDLGIPGHLCIDLLTLLSGKIMQQP